MHKTRSVRSLDFNLVSDGHLEMNPYLPTCYEKAPFLAAVGDMGYPSSTAFHNWVAGQSGAYDAIFFVAGNHEFYDTYSHVNAVEENLQKMPFSEHQN